MPSSIALFATKDVGLRMNIGLQKVGSLVPKGEKELVPRFGLN